MPSTQTPLIDVRKLNVVYFPGKSNEVHALKDITLQIYPGEFIIFFGPSGCGKSTLLYSISGLETNIAGDVLVKGQNLPTMTKKQHEAFHQRTIGMVFQAFYLIPSLSVLHNVTLPQYALNVLKPRREERAMKLMERFGIAAQAGELPQELSGGQQQRVALCRSLMNDPEILFADEPVGNLDSKSSEEVMKLLRELNDRDKKTVILVTHDPSHLHNAHRVFYLRDGQIVRMQENTEQERQESLVVKEAKAESVQAQARMTGLEQWAKTLTAEDLRRAAEVGKDAVQAKINDLLMQLTSEQRAKVEEYIRDLLAGVQTKVSEEGMERLARGILRLLRVPDTPDATTTRIQTWRTGADILLFERSPRGMPVLTLAASVRLRPILLRFKWMLIDAFAFLPRGLRIVRNAVAAWIMGVLTAVRNAVTVAARTATAWGRRITAAIAGWFAHQAAIVKRTLQRVWTVARARAIRKLQGIAEAVRCAAVAVRERMVRAKQRLLAILRMAWEYIVHTAAAARQRVRQALLSIRSALARAVQKTGHAVQDMEAAMIKEEKREVATLASAVETAKQQTLRRMHSLTVRGAHSLHRAHNRLQHLVAVIRRRWRHWRTRSHRHPPSVPHSNHSA